MVSPPFDLPGPRHFLLDSRGEPRYSILVVANSYIHCVQKIRHMEWAHLIYKNMLGVGPNATNVKRLGGIATFSLSVCVGGGTHQSPTVSWYTMDSMGLIIQSLQVSDCFIIIGVYYLLRNGMVRTCDTKCCAAHFATTSPRANFAISDTHLLACSQLMTTHRLSLVIDAECSPLNTFIAYASQENADKKP